MLNLELSTFHGDFEELDALATLLDSFHEQFSTQVTTKRMHWMTSWSDLINVASLGNGPDISQIGNTWISSLIGLNAIRPFKHQELEKLGGSLLFPDAGIPTQGWSVPWTSYTFVVCYRKDLLTEQGVEPEKAFETQISKLEIIQKLRNSVFESAWLAPFVPTPYPDMLHIAASWVWGAGGELVTCDQRQPKIAFTQPKAMQGLLGWLESYRAVSPAYRLNTRDCINLFSQGKVCAMLSGIRIANAMFEAADPETRKNIGFAPISNKPWIGGDSLVIWKHAQRDPEREKLALALVKLLTSRQGVVQFCRQANSMPARQDALEELYPKKHPLSATAQFVSKNGKRYPSISQWRSIEHQMVQTLDSIVHEAYSNPGRPSDEILKKYLTPLAERLDRTM